MKDTLESRLQEVVARLDPRFREEGQRDIRRLREAGGTSATRLMAILEDVGRSPELRSLARWALGALDVTEAVPALAAALAVESVGVRRECAFALEKLADVRVLSALVIALETDPEV